MAEKKEKEKKAPPEKEAKSKEKKDAKEPKVEEKKVEKPEEVKKEEVKAAKPERVKRPKKKSAKWKLYDASGEKMKRKNTPCPKCGEGVFMAEHKNRYSCGKCGYTAWK